FLNMIGREDFLTHPLFVNRAKATEEQADECNALLEPWFRARTKEEMCGLWLEQRVQGAPVYDFRAGVEHARLLERSYLAVVNSCGNVLNIPTHPFSGLGHDASHVRTVAAADGRPPPIPARGSRARPFSENVDPRRPLAGLRVIDF